MLGESKSVRLVVNRPAEEVWKIITSFQYDFSTTINYVKWEGDYKSVGSPGVYKFKIQEGSYKEAGVTVAAYEEGKHIAWHVSKGGGFLLYARRDFKVEAIDDKSCALVHDLSWR